MPMILGISPLQIPGSFSIANQQLYTSLRNHWLRPSVKNAVRVSGFSIPRHPLSIWRNEAARSRDRKWCCVFFCSADQGSLVTYLCISMKNPLEVYPSSRSHGSVAYSLIDLIVKESWKDPIFHHFPLPSLQEDVACLFAFTLPDKKKVSTCQPNKASNCSFGAWMIRNNRNLPNISDVGWGFKNIQQPWLL